MTDRLTAETARVGMRVRCGHTGHSGTVMRVEGRNVRRIRKAWAIRTTSYDHTDASSIYFAPTRAKARALIIRDMRDAWSCTWMEAASAIISIRREPNRDVALPHQHSLAKTIGPELLHIVVHAYGGTSLKAGNRDYFFTRADDADLLHLTALGLFEKGETLPSRSHGKGMAYFTLTALGRTVAAGEQPEYPNV